MEKQEYTFSNRELDAPLYPFDSPLRIERVFYRLKDLGDRELRLYKISTPRSTFEVHDCTNLSFPLSMETLPLPPSYEIAPYITSKESSIPDAKSIKVKISHLPLEEGIDLIEHVLKKTSAKLRIDANQTLSLYELETLANKIPKERLEYFEEPLKEIQEYEKVHLPIALDESLTRDHWEELLSFPSIHTLVVKPFQVPYKKAFLLAKEKGLGFVLGSSYEEPTPILKLAYHLGLHEIPLGIDTERYKEKALPCPIKQQSSSKRAIVLEDGMSLSYEELNKKIEEQRENQPFFFEPVLSLQLIVQLFQAWRLGVPVEWGSSIHLKNSLKGEIFSTIPASASISFLSSGTTGKPKELVWKAIDLLYAYTPPPLLQGALLSTPLPPNRIGGFSALLRAFLGGGAINLSSHIKSDFSLVTPTHLAKIGQGTLRDHAHTYIVGGAPSWPQTHIEKDRLIEAYGATEFGNQLFGSEIQKETFFSFTPSSELELKPRFKAQGLPEWISTHDRATLTKEGSWLFQGRTDRRIFSGGKKIDPGKIEQIVHSFPGVLFIHVEGIVHSYWGEEVVAFYHSLTPIETSLLKNWAKAHLYPEEIPKKWIYLHALPEGKKSKSEWRDLFDRTKEGL